MGLGDLIDDAGDGLEHLVAGAKHAAGTAIDAGSHLLGKGLNEVGLHTAAGVVTDYGDALTDHLGNQLPEQQLGHSSEPTQLIHGDVAAITQTAARLDQFASAFDQTAHGLAGIDTAHWQGSAADAFRHAYQQHPHAWSHARDACAAAAAAWRDYGQAVQQAQHQAAQAIALYQHGTQATAQATARYHQAVTTYHQQALAYNLMAADGADPGPMPQAPAAFADPGAADRQHAQELLTAARQQRDAAGDRARQTITTATVPAPQTPSFSQRLLADAGDLTTSAAVEGEHVVGGIAKGTGDLVKFARSVDPLDPYNQTHPAQFVDGVSSTVAGMAHAARHPQQLIDGLVGSHWKSDPAQALGRLVPTLIGTVDTDGATDAASAAAHATTDATAEASDAGADAATSAGTADHAPPPVDTRAGAPATPHVSAPAPALNAAQVQDIDTTLDTVANDLAKIHVHNTATTPESATSPAPTTALPAPHSPHLSTTSPSHSPSEPGHDPIATHPVTQPATTSRLRQRLDGTDHHPTPETPPTGGPLANDPQVHADLAHTALHQPDLSVMDDLDYAVVWRRDHGTLYRSGNRGAAAFTDGFPRSHMDQLDVRDHANYNPPHSSYVSTTTNPDYWQTWGSDAHYFYEIDAPGGVDTNATLGPHQNSHENEIAMPGGIRPERVKGLWPILHDPLTHQPALGDYIPNPHYRPLNSSNPQTGRHGP
jgi:uncharacterized protein YukE